MIEVFVESQREAVQVGCSGDRKLAPAGVGKEFDSVGEQACDRSWIREVRSWIRVVLMVLVWHGLNRRATDGFG